VTQYYDSEQDKFVDYFIKEAGVVNYQEKFIPKLTEIQKRLKSVQSLYQKKEKELAELLREK
jgi:hypothetical protein